MPKENEALTAAMKVVATLASDGRIYSLRNADEPQVKLNNYKIRTEPINPQGSNQKAAGDSGKQLLQHARDNDMIGVQTLLARGAPFSTDWLGMSALHFAVVNNNLEMCELLLGSGVNKDIKTKVDRTPLHLAAYYGRESIAQLLLNKGCMIDSRDMLRMTPLHWAVEKRQKCIVRLLLKYDADVTVLNKYNLTPIAYAVQTEQADILEALQKTKNKQLSRKFEKQHELETNAAVNSIVVNKQFTNNTEDSLRDNSNERAQRSKADALRKTDANAALLPGIKMKMQQQERQKLLAKNDKNANTNSLDLLNGIAMMNDDNVDDAANNLLNSALQNGRQLVLSEGGKMLLHQTNKDLILSNNNRNNKNNANILKGKNLYRITKVQKNENNIVSSTKDIEKLFAANPKSLTSILYPTNSVHSPSAIVSSDNDDNLLTDIEMQEASSDILTSQNICILSLGEFKKKFSDVNIKALQSAPTQFTGINTKAIAADANNKEIVNFDCGKTMPKLTSNSSSNNADKSMIENNNNNSNSNNNNDDDDNSSNSFNRKRAGVVRISTSEIAGNNAKIRKFAIPITTTSVPETITLPFNTKSNTKPLSLQIKTITRNMNSGNTTIAANNEVSCKNNVGNVRKIHHQSSQLSSQASKQYQQAGAVQFHPLPQLFLPNNTQTKPQTPTAKALAPTAAAAVAAPLKSASTSTTVQAFHNNNPPNLSTSGEPTTAVKLASTQDKSNSTIPLLTLPEICRQLTELRRQNQEMNRRIEVMQREKYDLRQRLEQLEVLFMDSRVEFES